MNINKENWGAFVIDYYDGNLSDEKTQELFAFLNAHPYLKEDFENYLDVSLISETVVFDEKNNLKNKEIVPYKFINDNNYEKIIVRYLDDELSENEIIIFNEFLKKNSVLYEEIKLWKKTKLIANKEIVFPNKKILKKRTVVPLLLKWSAVAAIFIIVFFISKSYFYYNNNTVKSTNDIAIQNLIPKGVNFKCFHENISLLQYKVKSNIVFEKKDTKKPLVYKMATITSMKKIKYLSIVGNNNINTSIIQNSNIFHSDMLVINENKPHIKNLLLEVLLQPVNNVKKLIAQKQRSKKERHFTEPVSLKMLDDGVNIFNTITGAGVVMAKVYNNKGQLISYRVLGNNWYIKRNIKVNNNN